MRMTSRSPRFLARLSTFTRSSSSRIKNITPVQHRDFAARFGALHTHPLYPGVETAPELFILDHHPGNPTDNDAWHTDVTFIETPPMALDPSCQAAAADGRRHDLVEHARGL